MVLSVLLDYVLYLLQSQVKLPIPGSNISWASAFCLLVYGLTGSPSSSLDHENVIRYVLTPDARCAMFMIGGDEMEKMDCRLTISFSAEEAAFLNKRSEELRLSRSYIVRQALRDAAKALKAKKNAQP